MRRGGGASLGKGAGRAWGRGESAPWGRGEPRGGASLGAGRAWGRGEEARLRSGSQGCRAIGRVTRRCRCLSKLLSYGDNGTERRPQLPSPPQPLHPSLTVGPWSREPERPFIPHYIHYYEVKRRGPRYKLRKLILSTLGVSNPTRQMLILEKSYGSS